MSAPPGSRGSRTSTSTRSRGSIRGGSRGRGARISAGEQQSTRATTLNARGNNLQPHLKTNGQQNQLRGKPRNRTDPTGVQLSSAILSHAGTISKSKDQPWRSAAEQDSTSYKQRMNDLYQTLKESRERERKKAIKDGFLADPDRPTSLANAITPVGTCQDMCPEFERVERIVQLMVDANEKMPSALNAEARVPCEDLMVKRFRRSAAGYDEQLPSDIRSPTVLQTTLNHLFDSVIGGQEPLATTHKFVWDRTRGIRNDFSIQQVTKVEDLKIAIDCFERIARFHILSLHQLSHPDKDNGEFDHHQEREQLNNTLLSLMYYYDDSRHKLSSPNEAEFRAYCVIFEIQDQRPDLEDRAQNWPRGVLKDARVKTALKLYAAAGNTSDEQGPLRPRTPFSIAQANTRGFFEVVQSSAVSYIMACVAEIYFNLVRATALESIWKVYKGKRPGAAKVEDWLLEDMTYALGFDNHDQSRSFCEEHEFETLEREDGEEYLNLGSVTGSNLKDNNPRRKQIFSRYLVESKRLGRSFTAVINGLSVSQAESQGLVNGNDANDTSVAKTESLFIDADSEDEQNLPKSGSSNPFPLAPTNGNGLSKLNGGATPFSSNSFGIPSSKPNPFKPVDSLQTQHKSLSESGSENPTKNQPTNPFAPKQPSNFNFSPAPNPGQLTTSAAPNPFSATTTPKFNFVPVANANKTQESESEIADSSTGEQKPQEIAASGAPFLDTLADKSSAQSSVFSQNTQPPTAATFSFQTSPLFAQNTSKAKTEPTPLSKGIQNHNQVDDDASPKITKPSETREPIFSFETSPLFQPAANDVQTQKSSPPSPFSLNTSTPKPPQPSPFAPPSLIKASPSQPPTKPPDFFSEPASQPLSNVLTKPLSSPFNLVATNTADYPTSSPLHELSKPNVTSLGPTSATIPSIAVHEPQQAQNERSAPMPAVPAAHAIPLATTQPPKPDPRPAALDKVTDGLMFDHGGLIQQYIEMSIVPIMRSAIAQFEDEKSWREARNHRFASLGRKYFQRWKNNAWNLGLMRRGRKQRQSLARSMQSLARETQRRQEEVSRSVVSNSVGSRKAKENSFANELGSMPPPAIPRDKRQSLPSNLEVTTRSEVQTPRTHKRKLDDTELGDRAESHQTHTSNHKRSNTVDSTINKESAMSGPPHRQSHSRYRQSIDISKLGDGSALGDALIKQARRMAPDARSDTTQTDYFRLKALGIDPDTPAVSLTSKRGAKGGERHGISNISREPINTDAGAPGTVKQPVLESSPTTRVSVPDDDEEFFASIHAIRSTLADSTSWFQSERKSIERSITPSHASTSPRPGQRETAAEMRLREIRERGHTPSRSEIRLRAMGDKSLLPADFWDREEIGKQANAKRKLAEKDSKRRNGPQDQQTTSADEIAGFTALNDQKLPPRNHAKGLLAFASQRTHKARVNGYGSHDGDRDQQSQQSGTPSEEVIELSD